MKINDSFAVFVRPAVEGDMAAPDGQWMVHVVGHREGEDLTHGHSPEHAVYMAFDLLCALADKDPVSERGLCDDYENSPLTDEQAYSVALGELDIAAGKVAPWDPDDPNKIGQHFAMISLGRNLTQAGYMAAAWEDGLANGKACGAGLDCWWYPGCGESMFLSPEERLRNLLRGGAR